MTHLASKSDIKRRIISPENARLMLFFALALVLAGCLPKKQPEAPPPEPIVVEPEPILSTAPIVDASKQQVIFAQTALTKLGFKLGAIDGLWGPRSAKALQNFEAQHNLTSAGGFLSEANLATLREQSALTPEAAMATWQRPKVAKKVGIKAKLSAEIDATSPQLVIVEEDYTLYSQPNPFSAVVLELQPGTGIYVLSENEDWLTVETVARQRGYIQINN